MATEKVTIPFPRSRNEFRRLWEATEFAVDIKNWLVEQELLMYVDFEWKVNTDNKTVDITFFNKTHYASMVVLKFQGTK